MFCNEWESLNDATESPHSATLSMKNILRSLTEGRWEILSGVNFI